jgi:hypothetical protein
MAVVVRGAMLDEHDGRRQLRRDARQDGPDRLRASDGGGHDNEPRARKAFGVHDHS